jgi:hypothetical protein
MTTDKLALLARKREELSDLLKDVKRHRALIDRGLRLSSMTDDEREQWRQEVNALLNGTGIMIVRERQ